MSIDSDVNLDAAQERCDDVRHLLPSIEDELLAWGRRRHKPHAYHRDLRRLRAVANELPDWWHDAATPQVQAAAIMRQPLLMRKFRTHAADLLAPAERNLLRHFGRHPWFWSLLSVTKPLRGDFCRMNDHLSSGNELLMYSPAITGLYREGSRLFFTLSFWNGMCCQTFGPLHYFRGYEPFDFAYLARALLPEVLRTQGLEAVVAAKPAHFLLLNRWAETPPLAHSGGTLHVCAHEARLDTFAISKNHPGLEIRGENREKGILKASLKGSNPPMECADVYHDRPRRRLVVVTSALEDYLEIARLLRDQVDLPDEPDWYASMNMVVAATTIAGKEHPALAYERQLEPAPDRDADAALKPVNAFIKELVRCRNVGEEYSLDELATRFGMTMETAREVEASVTRLGERDRIDIEGGIAGYRPPPPARRGQLQALPSRSEVFVLQYGPRAHQAYAERRERIRSLVAEQRAAGAEVSAAFDGDGDDPPLTRLPRLLEDLFFASWRAHDPTVLTYTLYLLCQAGDTARPVRDYASELLRTFHQVLLPNSEPAHLQGFIDKYALFCWEILEPLGLVEIEHAVDRGRAAEATYRMSAGPLLNEFVHLSPDPN
ncbi:MAG: hypothetical protein OXC12_16265 [Spirochaetaceae bacterium]|nr:hypothetical protein [Spirochaetaceae bacterium]